MISCAVSDSNMGGHKLPFLSIEGRDHGAMLTGEGGGGLSHCTFLNLPFSY